MNLDIANLKSTATNAELSPEARNAASSQLRAIANRTHDPRNEDARLALNDLQPTPEPRSAGSAQDSDGENNPIESGAVKAMVMMGLCDQEQTRLGREAFDYDPEVKAVCGLWLEARKRALSGVPLFKQLFERVLAQNDRMILGLHVEK